MVVVTPSMVFSSPALMASLMALMPSIPVHWRSSSKAKPNKKASRHKSQLTSAKLHCRSMHPVFCFIEHFFNYAFVNVQAVENRTVSAMARVSPTMFSDLSCNYPFASSNASKACLYFLYNGQPNFSYNSLSGMSFLIATRRKMLCTVLDFSYLSSHFAIFRWHAAFRQVNVTYRQRIKLISSWNAAFEMIVPFSSIHSQHLDNLISVYSDQLLNRTDASSWKLGQEMIPSRSSYSRMTDGLSA